jgi:hypothetical protein
MLGSIELDTWLIFIGTTRTIRQRAGSGVLPDGLECVLDLLELHPDAQGYVAVEVNLERGIVAWHGYRV